MSLRIDTRESYRYRAELRQDDGYGTVYKVVNKTDDPEAFQPALQRGEFRYVKGQPVEAEGELDWTLDHPVINGGAIHAYRRLDYAFGDPATQVILELQVQLRDFIAASAKEACFRRAWVMGTVGAAKEDPMRADVNRLYQRLQATPLPLPQPQNLLYDWRKQQAERPDRSRSIFARFGGKTWT